MKTLTLRTLGLGLLACIAVFAVPGARAHASEPAAQNSGASVAPGVNQGGAVTVGAPTAVNDAQHGLVVLGLGSATDQAWPLARSLYADAALRPSTLDEAHARVLVGEAPDDAGPAELRDLADTRAAIHGDDAASRRLLESIALSLHVKGIVVVSAGAAPGASDGSGAAARPEARVFVTTSGAYDAVRYEPDPSPAVTWGTRASAVSWVGAVQALRRGFADLNPGSGMAVGVTPLVTPSEPPVVHASPLAVHPIPSTENPAADKSNAAKSSSRSFYQSPWFWAAAGAAAFAAGAVYFATRNDGSDNIQLQVQVPK